MSITTTKTLVPIFTLLAITAVVFNNSTSVALNSQEVTTNSSNRYIVNEEDESFLSTIEVNIDSTIDTLDSNFQIANPVNSSNHFIEHTKTELSALNQDELLAYMLNYRQEFLFDTDFMAREYQLFQNVLELEPFAALDYMIAIGHDASSEFFYNFLYTDFMIHNGKSDDVVDYINRFGPQSDLLTLVVFAELTEEISPHIRREVLNEYILGNVDYHSIISAAQWDIELTEDEKVSAFLNTTPGYVNDPYDLISGIVALDNPSTYSHLNRYLENHPDKYRLYSIIKTLTDLNLVSTVDNMMYRHDNYSVDDQIQIALIALDFGHYDALEFLIRIAKEPVITNRPINIDYVILNHISAPPYINKTIDWAAEEVHSFKFNPFTKMYEY